MVQNKKVSQKNRTQDEFELYFWVLYAIVKKISSNRKLEGSTEIEYLEKVGQDFKKRLEIEWRENARMGLVISGKCCPNNGVWNKMKDIFNY